MNPVLRLGCILLAALVLVGCQTVRGWFSREDPELQPAELVEFTPEVSVERLWSVDVGKGTGKSRPNLQPRFEDGLIWVGDHEGRIVAVDADSGRIQREFDTELPLSAGPGVVGDRLLVGTFEGEIYLLDATNGRQLWSNRLSSEILAYPVLHDGIVVARSIDGRMFGFDVNDGSRVWAYDRSVPLLTLRGNSDPVPRAGRIFAGYDNGMAVALNADDGSVVWEQRVSEPEGRTELDRLADIDGPMVIVGGEIYVVTYHGRLAGMALESGRLLWVRDIRSYTGLSLSRTQLATSDDASTIWVVDRRNGSTIWQDDTLARRQITRPVFFQDLLVVADLEGYLHFFDATSGRLVGRTSTTGERPVTAPLVVGNTLYLLDTEGRLSAWRTSPSA